MRLCVVLFATLAVVGYASAAALSMPVTRPPLWAFRTYADSVGWSCKVNPNNVLFLNVEHLDIPGVTSDMVRWLYNGGLTQSSVHPQDKNVYSNFLLMHPRDHAAHTASTLPAKVKDTQYSWYEFPLTGCKTQSNPGAPYVCPKAGTPNPGYTAKTSPNMLALAEKVNATSTPLDFSKTGIELGVQGCNENNNCAYIIKTRHSWKDLPTGLRLTTQVQYGLDLGLAAKSINPRVLKGWSGVEDPMKKCQRAALHAIEEFGALQYWLPAAYKSAGN